MFKRIALGFALAGLAGVAFAAPLSYKIDANHPQVTATWSHFGFSHPFANFGQVDGTIVYDPQNVGASSVKVTLPLAGLDSTVPALDEHLRSKDFFEAEKYPTITFNSTKVEAAGDKKLRVTGDLTVHGVTKPAVLDVTLNGAGPHPMTKRETVGFDATTTIKRADFGVGAYVPNVSDDIQIRITTEASVPKADGAPASKKK
ncbi:YceI family protein [Cognatilysobacter terrigena]|uniref:YceI family protein n=2 Tax=Cognatilysobacter terrigena TaxID=2488749 RepID=UPI00105F1114|nr:YceI family protein [Lysobacter terrigena]